MTQILLIKDLYVDVGNTSIVNGLNLEIKSGETHAIMGPNGSGKSTLAKTIAGHPDYKIRSGAITYMDQNLNDLSIEERSNLGIFLGFQYPIEIPGLSNTAFLKAAINAKRKYNDLDELSASDFLIDLKEKSRMVDIEQSFLSREESMRDSLVVKKSAMKSYRCLCLSPCFQFSMKRIPDLILIQ